MVLITSSMLTIKRLAPRRLPARRLLPRTTATTSNNSHTQTPPSSASTAWKPVVLAGVSLSLGFALGQAYQQQQYNLHHHHHHNKHLPDGLPRTCCQEDKGDEEEDVYFNNLTDAQKALPEELKRIVGADNVVNVRETKHQATAVPFLRGARIGHATHQNSNTLCVVTPDRLQDVIDVVQAVVDADGVIIPQGQNTGLTGGSVPRTFDAEKHHTHDTRPAVVLSPKRLNRLFPIDDGQRVVCLAGAGLADIAQFLQQHFPSRTSHSTLGSTFLNPTAAAGVALGSGGTQVRQGPAYTERALYLTISTNKWQERVVNVVNTLGLENMDAPLLADPDRARKMDGVASRIDTWSRWIAGGYARIMRYSDEQSEFGQAPASDTTYGARLCDFATNPIARYNADTRGPAPNRTEGKVIILATVHDTFPKPQIAKTFWISTNSLETALQFRRQVCLDNPTDLPISVEYMDRDAYDVVDGAGRLLATLIRTVGTASPVVRHFWNAKLWIEAGPGWDTFCDRFLYAANKIVPSVLPQPVQALGKQFDHHMAVTVGDFGQGELDRFMERMRAFQAEHGEVKMQVYECKTPAEAASLTAFRFVAAPAFRTYCVGQDLQGLSVDYALPKDDGRPPPLSADDNDGSTFAPVKRMRYSHFACNVVHEDLAYERSANVPQAKKALKQAVEQVCHGKLPAEHGHGTEYTAPPATLERWKRLDPLNVCNPGVGGLSGKFKYEE